jgi:hypothetical protein
MKKTLFALVVVLCVLCVAGCTVIKDQQTGHTQWVFNPAALQLIDTVITDANAIAPAAAVAGSIFFPGAAPIISAIVALIAGIAGTWLKMKPKPQ